MSEGLVGLLQFSWIVTSKSNLISKSCQERMAKQRTTTAEDATASPKKEPKCHQLSPKEKEKLFKSVFTSEDTQKLLLLQEELREKYGSFYDIMLSGKTILEILPKGISKKTQFPYLKTIYPGTELWCIGDFHNDVEMLEGADVAVCPENAVDEIKAICKLQVCHCKDGALADMIDQIEQRIDNQNASEK